MTQGDAGRPSERTGLTPGSGCPSQEELAAFIDGRLSGEDRTRVEAHVASCADCHEIFSETVRFLGESGHSAESADKTDRATTVVAFRPRTGRRLAVAAGGLLAVAAGLVLALRISDPLWWERYVRGASRPELVGLVAAVADRRPTEARLTGGFQYGPPPTGTRGPDDPDISPDLRIAAATVEKSTQAQDTPENVAALAVARLVLGDVDRAVALLEESVERSPGNGMVQSDLSAAYLARFAATGRAEDLPRALTAADRAMSSPNPPIEAAFNRALALEKLQLRSEATRAWNDYVQRDSASQWAVEARRHLAALGSTAAAPARAADLLATLTPDDRAGIERVVREYPQETREFVEDRLLPRWGTEEEPGKIQTLKLAAAIAHASASVSGDSLLTDAIAAIERAVAAGPSESARLARAHRAYGEGRQHFGAFRLEKARALFEASRADFERAGSPFQGWSDLHLAILTYYGRELEAANARLAVQRAAVPGSYLSLAARLRWMSGLIHTEMARYDVALDDQLAALSVYERLHESGNAAAVENVLAETYRELGETAAGWKYRISGLGRLSGRSMSRTRQSLLLGAAEAAKDLGLLSASLSFNSEAAEMTGSEAPVTCAQVGVRLAATLRELGRTSDAVQRLSDARACVSRIEDGSLGRRLSAELIAEEGLAMSRSNREGSIAALSKSIDYVKGATFFAFLPHLYLERGRAHRDGDDIALAEQDFDDGIAVFETFRSHSEGALRVSYFDESWRLFDELIDLQLVARHDPAAALATAERGRRLAPAASADGGLTLSDVQRRLPAGVIVLYFFALEDHLVTWVVSRDAQHLVNRQVRLAHIEELATRLQRAIVGAPGQSTQFEDASAALYDEVFRPARGFVSANASLLIVPDRALHRVPFSSLYDRERRRFLVEDHAVTLAPSLSWAVEEGSRRSPASVGRALVIVPPPVAGDSGLRPLVHAADEGREVAGLYPGSTLLEDEEARVDVVVSAMPGYDIVHFAGHAVANPEYPDLSRLLFAPDAGSRVPGMLFADRIEKLRLSGNALVVLSACGTAAGRISRGQGPLGLSRSFLVAGAASVVGTLWDVDDYAARVLFEHFYRRLRQTGDPGQSLRDAQLALLTSADTRLRQVSAWGAFVHIGRPFPH